MANSDAGQYFTYVQDWIFRDDGQLKIPKNFNGGASGRKKMYQLAIDVIIQSISREDYQNYKSTPSHGFYGYATLVLQDCCDQKIPLQYSRTRIYEGRITEAFQAWNSLAFWLNTEKQFLELIANSLRGEGAPVENICDVEPFKFNFLELPLREVYVNCDEGTQFSIEMSWTEPAPFTDSCGIEHLGESNQDDNDGGKDDGLPKDGVAPKQNSPSNPFGGNKPTSSPPLGDPFYIDPSELDEESSDASIPPPDEGTGSIRWMKVEARVKRPEFAGGCSATRVAKDYYTVLDDTQLISLTPNAGQGDAGCGNVVQLGGWKVQLTGGTPFDVGNSDSAPQISFQRGDSLPSSELYFE